MLGFDAFGELPFAHDARPGVAYPGGAPATNASVPIDLIALQVQQRVELRGARGALRARGR